MVLERTCHECGSFNAGWGYGRPGVFQQQLQDQRWACDEPDCRDAVQAWWRATYHAERETLARAPARAPRPAPQPDLFGGVESCPSTDLGRAA
ncbi:hypothetical protein [uncultured Methylobacterium sp.]|jgi:hypothetical protein|uniref:hypothetical protein n=1 Tax=uncultured Methylobacterium sp. TaxID=157278 RepID=UPI002629990E|nr:hypothetical protein [uncultured Methylobacterium sp.]